MKTLMIVAHPDLNSGIANKTIIEQVKSASENLEVRDLTALYPDFNIDAAAEQAALLEADSVVFQYPFYWYNMPAILKQWFDVVFSYGFAYGSSGDKLQGKHFILSFTIGGPQESYNALGYNHFCIPEFLKHLEQTAYLSQMNYLEPIYSHGMVYIEGVYNTPETVVANAKQHAERLIERLQQLSNPSETIIAFVNDWFAQLDALPAEVDFYQQFIDSNSVFTFPEGEFIGQAGFSAWYAEMRKHIQPNCDHRIENISIVANGDGYAVQLSIKLIAKSTNGKGLQLNVKEKWTLALADSGAVTIKTYHVDLVA